MSHRADPPRPPLLLRQAHIIRVLLHDAQDPRAKSFPELSRSDLSIFDHIVQEGRNTELGIIAARRTSDEVEDLDQVVNIGFLRRSFATLIRMDSSCESERARKLRNRGVHYRTLFLSQPSC